MLHRSVSRLVDDLIAAEKEIGGHPDWQHTEYDPTELRMLMPLLIDGVSSGAQIEVKSYPSITPMKFRLMLIMEKCIFRIDFVVDETHTNSLDRPSDLYITMIRGPHYHSWYDNKRFCTQSTLPDRLKNARVVPADLRTFDNVFRWFCGELNIVQPPPGYVDLPRRTTLL